MSLKQIEKVIDAYIENDSSTNLNEFGENINDHDWRYSNTKYEIKRWKENNVIRMIAKAYGYYDEDDNGSLVIPRINLNHATEEQKQITELKNRVHELENKLETKS